MCHPCQSETMLQKLLLLLSLLLLFYYLWRGKCFFPPWEKNEEDFLNIFYATNIIQNLTKQKETQSLIQTTHFPVKENKETERKKISTKTFQERKWQKSQQNKKTVPKNSKNRIKRNHKIKNCSKKQQKQNQKKPQNKICFLQKTAKTESKETSWYFNLFL